MINGQFYSSFVKSQTLAEYSVYFVHTIHISTYRQKNRSCLDILNTLGKQANSLWTSTIKSTNYWRIYYKHCMYWNGQTPVDFPLASHSSYQFISVVSLEFRDEFLSKRDSVCRSTDLQLVWGILMTLRSLFVCLSYHGLICCTAD